MTARLRCCIPFCRRTTRNDRGWVEWICGKHWLLVDADIKALRRRTRRKGRHRLDDMLWRRAKRQAIELALAKGPTLPCDDRGQRKPSRRRLGAAP